MTLPTRVEMKAATIEAGLALEEFGMLRTLVEAEMEKACKRGNYNTYIRLDQKYRTDNQEGTPSPAKAGLNRMWDRLVGKGYTVAAWREDGNIDGIVIDWS